MGEYGTILILLGLACGIAGILHMLASVFGPRSRNRAKDAPFECGHLPEQPFRQRVSIKFYVVALLFVLFDMEAVLLFPWAVVFRELGWPGFVSAVSFVVMLSFGLVYVWKKGALDWE